MIIIDSHRSIYFHTRGTIKLLFKKSHGSSKKVCHLEILLNWNSVDFFFKVEKLHLHIIFSSVLTVTFLTGIICWLLLLFFFSFLLILVQLNKKQKLTFQNFALKVYSICIKVICNLALNTVLKIWILFTKMLTFVNCFKHVVGNI